MQMHLGGETDVCMCTRFPLSLYAFPCGHFVIFLPSIAPSTFIGFPSMFTGFSFLPFLPLFFLANFVSSVSFAFLPVSGRGAVGPCVRFHTLFPPGPHFAGELGLFDGFDL